MKRTKSGIKNVRKTKKRHARNLEAKNAIKKAFKAAEKAVAAKTAEAKELLKKAVVLIDKAVQRGIIHRNKAARKKSSLQLKFNAIK